VLVVRRQRRSEVFEGEWEAQVRERAPGGELQEAIRITGSSRKGLTTRQTAEADGRSWEVTTRWQQIGGRFEPVEVTVEGVEPGMPLTATTMRQLPIGTLHEEARRYAAGIRETSDGAGRMDEDLIALAPVGSKRGSELTDVDLKATAKVYRRAYDGGEPVTKAVADHFGISTSAAAKRIMRARDAGLLDGIGRGMA
jgi:hypothetical protein